MNETVNTNRSDTLAAEIAASRWTHLLPLLILFLAFAYHLGNLPEDGAVLLADSFRYIWTIEFSRYFFTASSLTVRAIYLLLDNDQKLIAITQLTMAFAAPVFIYLSLKGRHFAYNMLLGILLGLLYFSTSAVKFHDVVSSESIYTSLFITFTAILFAYHGRGRLFWLLFVGILFIFSRNPAPYIVLVQLLLYFIFNYPKPSGRKMLVVVSILAGFSFFALWLIQCCDTTKEINVADNLYSRVFPYPEKVDFFQKQYGMPVGPFIDVCQLSGSNVNLPCFDHEAIYTGDSVTRQYRLTNDDYGLADWIRKDGMRAWTNFIIFQDTRHTLEVYINSFQSLSQLMFADVKNEKTFDIFPLLTSIFKKLGILNFIGISIYLVAGTVIYFFAGRDVTLKLGLVYILSAFPAFFIGLFGDSEEIKRYTYPAILSLYIGISIYFLAIGRFIFHRTNEALSDHRQ